MKRVQRTLELDAETDERLTALAKQRGMNVSAVVTDALALYGLGDDLDLEEDLRRLREFEQTRMGVPHEEVKAWVDSWGAPDELPPPVPRKLS
jgi:predicted transcriptional regulator